MRIRQDHSDKLRTHFSADIKYPSLSLTTAMESTQLLELYIEMLSEMRFVETSIGNKQLHY
jgi:hypothetical protein